MPKQKSEQQKEDDVVRIGHLISLLERVMRKELSETLAPLNLTLQQYAALQILNNNEKISNAKLAKWSFMTPQSANEMVAALEDKLLVTRQPAEDHGRVIHILISKEGKRILRKADTAVLTVEKRMLDTIPAGARGKLRAQLVACISALNTAISSEFPLNSEPKKL